MATSSWLCPKCPLGFKTIKALRRHAEIYHKCFVRLGQRRGETRLYPRVLLPKPRRHMDVAGKSLSVASQGFQDSNNRHHVAVQGHAAQVDAIQPPGNVQLQTFASVDSAGSIGTGKSTSSSIQSRLSTLASASSLQSDGSVLNVHSGQRRSSSRCSSLPRVMHLALPDDSKANSNCPLESKTGHNRMKSVSHKSNTEQAESNSQASHKAPSPQAAKHQSIDSRKLSERSSLGKREANSYDCVYQRRSPGGRDQSHAPAFHCPSPPSESRGRHPHSCSPAPCTAEYPVRQLSQSTGSPSPHSKRTPYHYSYGKKWNPNNSPGGRDQSHSPARKAMKCSSPQLLRHSTSRQQESRSQFQHTKHCSVDQNRSLGRQSKIHSPCQVQRGTHSSSNSPSQSSTRSSSRLSSHKRGRSRLPAGHSTRQTNRHTLSYSPDRRDQRRSRHSTSSSSFASRHSSNNSRGKLERSCSRTQHALPRSIAGKEGRQVKRRSIARRSSSRSSVTCTPARHPNQTAGLLSRSRLAQASGTASGKQDRSSRYPDRRTSTRSSKSSCTYSGSIHSSKQRQKDHSNDRPQASPSEYAYSRNAHNRLPRQGVIISRAGSTRSPDQYERKHSVDRYAFSYPGQRVQSVYSVRRHAETVHRSGLSHPYPYKHSTNSAFHHSSGFVKLEWHKTETSNTLESSFSRTLPYAFHHLVDTFVSRCPLSALETWFYMYPNLLPPATKSPAWIRFSEDHAKVRTVCLSMAHTLGEDLLKSLPSGATHSCLKRFLC